MAMIFFGDRVLGLCPSLSVLRTDSTNSCNFVLRTNIVVLLSWILRTNIVEFVLRTNQRQAKAAALSHLTTSEGLSSISTHFREEPLNIVYRTCFADA